MANSEHLAKLKEGVRAWNDWRKANKRIVPDLHAADLYGAEFADVNLSTAQLGGAFLSGANLSKADLSGADVSEASLVNANLYGAHLSRADLRDANLVGADLTKASISDTIFGDTDLSDAKGLETVRHYGPSTIGIDTIYRSHGKIPVAFLRGAGVPENFIEYMASLTGKALEFYSCFISYSTKDQEFADRLHADLQNIRGPLLVCAARHANR